MDNYFDLFTVEPGVKWENGIKTSDPDRVKVKLNIRGVLGLKRLKRLLLEEHIYFPEFANKEIFAKFLEDNGIQHPIFTNILENENAYNSLIEGMEKVFDRHNLYFDKMKRYKISRIANNYSMHSMYKISSDPANQIQAQTPVDATTGPLKDVSNNNLLEKYLLERSTPGNFANKAESIDNNLVGKEGIAVCAVGLKTFFALTLYANDLLNNGTVEELKRILIGSNGQGILINSIGERGKVFRTLANIRPLNPATVLDIKVLESLATSTNDVDSALVLSALLSLATDNAKELALSKLNAGTKTLGMYIYGISIGMSFQEVAHIMMSPVGNMINLMLRDNSFTGYQGYLNVNDTFFEYFDEGPISLFNKFNKALTANREGFPNPLDILIMQINEGKPDKDRIDSYGLSAYIGKWAKNDAGYADAKLKLESFRAAYDKYYSDHYKGFALGKQYYNLLIDAIEKYFYQRDILNKNPALYSDFKTLAEGALEMKRLGRILSLNLGIKSKPDEFVSQLDKFERAIYDKLSKEERSSSDFIDIIQFVREDGVGEGYRKKCIDKYERIKHSFNILDVVWRVPHYRGYIKALAAAKLALMQSYKFRSIRANSLEVSTRVANYEPNVVKGLLNYIGYKTIADWFTSRNVAVVIPAGNRLYNQLQELVTIPTSSRISLSTEYGRASFKQWMEQEVIPNLKKGIHIEGADPNVYLKDNKFILDLTTVLRTNTVDHNPITKAALPINMLPRIDSERMILDSYRLEFNKLAKYTYQYKHDTYKDGKLVTKTVDIPLVDLFIYYTMIADEWKLAENSLVPIFADFDNTGIIADFHEFEDALDKSGKTLQIDSIPEDMILYIAPFKSPYTAKSKYTLYRNPITRRYELLKKDEKPTKQTGNPEDLGDYDVFDDNVLDLADYSDYDLDTLNTGPTSIGGYSYVRQGINSTLYKSGEVPRPISSVILRVNHDRVEVSYVNDPTLNKDYYPVSSISINGKPHIPRHEYAEELHKVLRIKLNGNQEYINQEQLLILLENDLNPETC